MALAISAFTAKHGLIFVASSTFCEFYHQTSTSHVSLTDGPVSPAHCKKPYKCCNDFPEMVQQRYLLVSKAALVSIGLLSCVLSVQVSLSMVLNVTVTRQPVCVR